MVETLVEKDRRVLWHPFTQTAHPELLLPVVAAHGATLVLEDGHEIIDGISSWWCNLHGHCHPAIAEAIAEQAVTLDHVLFGGCTHEPAVRLAEELLRILPSNHARIFYSDNGSTAVEVALKMSLQYWSNRGEKRLRILALENAYHGDTFGAMSVGQRGIFTAPFKDLLFDVNHLPSSASADGTARCRELCSTGEVAAFIFEPSVQGAAGMRVWDKEILQSYAEICKSFGVLCIADEVMTGFGRTGPLFASSALSLRPDLVCLSKGLTGGTLPLAVTSCTEEIFSAFVSTDRSKTLFHGHTFTANPIACAAARASLRLTLSSDCVAARERIEKSHSLFALVLAKRSDVENVRVVGTILAFDVPVIRVEGSSADTISLRNKLVGAFVDAGVLLRPLGEVVYLMPPYCIKDDELTCCYEAILSGLDCIVQRQVINEG